MNSQPTTVRLGSLLQQFFLERLMQQRHASGCTIAAYRDCLRLLLAFAEQRLGKRPANLALQDLNATFVLEFLEHLEKHRHNSIRTRNARFAAIRAFMHYAGTKEPTALDIAQSVLAIPLKRFERRLVGFLSRKQIQAILDAPAPDTWTGRRDRVMFSTLYNTGARVSELPRLLLSSSSVYSRNLVSFLHSVSAYWQALLSALPSMVERTQSIWSQFVGQLFTRKQFIAWEDISRHLVEFDV